MPSLWPVQAPAVGLGRGKKHPTPPTHLCWKKRFVAFCIFSNAVQHWTPNMCISLSASGKITQNFSPYLVFYPDQNWEIKHSIHALQLESVNKWQKMLLKILFPLAFSGYSSPGDTKQNLSLPLCWSWDQTATLPHHKLQLRLLLAKDDPSLTECQSSPGIWFPIVCMQPCIYKISLKLGQFPHSSFTLTTVWFLGIWSYLPRRLLPVDRKYLVYVGRKHQERIMRIKRESFLWLITTADQETQRAIWSTGTLGTCLTLPHTVSPHCGVG